MKLRYIAEAGKPGRGGRKLIYTPRTEELAKEIGIHPKALKRYFKLGCPQTSAEDIKKWRKEHVRKRDKERTYTPRMKELAKEVGIHPGTLRRHFILGCPQTSAEDIKKWREEQASKRGKERTHTPRIGELAKEIGIHPNVLWRYFKLGCPQTSAEDIKKWREEHVGKRGRKRIYTPRTKELAKEVGIHPSTLMNHFKLGCPQTSAEDIKKWRKENLLIKPDYISAQSQESDLESDAPRRFTNTGKVYSDDDSIAKQREGKLGKYTANIVPFGYRLDGNKLVLDNTEQAIIKRMLSRREKGATLQQIADELSADGIQTKTGMGRWNSGNVYMIIRRNTPENQRRSGYEYPMQEIIDRILKRKAEGATLQRIADELNADGIKTERGGRWVKGSIYKYMNRRRNDITKRRKLKMVDTPNETISGTRQFSNTGQEYYNDDTIAQARKSPYNKNTISIVPFGFRLNDDRTELLVDPVEQATIKRIRKLRNEGFKLQEIADILNAEDIKTKTGSKWNHSIVARIIRKTDTPSSTLASMRGSYKPQNSAERAVISRITKRRAEGAKLQEIADELNADGIRTWNGKQWTPGLVHWAAEMARSRQHTTESKRDFRSLLESVLESLITYTRNVK